MNQNVKLDKREESALVADIHALSHDGRGIATLHHKTTFIDGALPNEKVTYKITQKRSHYNEANLLTVLNPSPERVVPPCAHFGVCGGCSLQHMAISTQLALKQQTLLDQLKHFGHVAPVSVLPPLHAQTVGYRRKARLGVKFVIKKNKLLVGFREKSSHYLADLERCAVLHPTVGERFAELSELILSLEQHRHIPQIEVAIGDTQAALVFRHLQPLSDQDHAKLIAFGKAYDFHIYLQPNPPVPVHPLWPAETNQRLSYTLPDFQLEFLFHPLDFTQINLEINRLMVKQAVDLLDLQPEDRVLDLFCGIGNFSLPIARYARQVTGIEGSVDMVKRAADNAQHNRIENADFYAANLQELPATFSWLTSYDKVLLDPPRAGAKEILPYLKNMSARRIVYVSCNPATLARDAGELVHQYGYRLMHVGVMNMFPHTSHIEAMAVFDKV
ncbi:MAG: 23S rRNA (uracil(1939)-C(5))-methyltransferase RlmD [Gammaproteobacteria bacterium]|nr:MAG: 23S rRNA (uracil(1939)-C(5))-methyltransferase RlmD [Gammaproteobacteria bacterium]